MKSEKLKNQPFCVFLVSVVNSIQNEQKTPLIHFHRILVFIYVLFSTVYSTIEV